MFCFAVQVLDFVILVQYHNSEAGDSMTHTLKIDMPEAAFSALRQDPDGFARELRLAAAVKWYELGMISQGRAAEIAGLSREPINAIHCTQNG